MPSTNEPTDAAADRRTRRTLIAGAAAAGALAAIAPAPAGAQAVPNPVEQEHAVSPKAFVYTELQISIPFAQVPWDRINATILRQPGFLNKTWLAGAGNGSVGGFYAFASVGAAEAFVTTAFPAESASFGVTHTTRIFDAVATREASLDIGSPHYGAAPAAAPRAYVYTEVQVSVPFEAAPWGERNPVLRQQPGLLAKTWLSGLHTRTLGGLDAFDSLDAARAFAVEAFPRTARAMNAAYYARVFDADVTREASVAMLSPYYV